MQITRKLLIPLLALLAAHSSYVAACADGDPLTILFTELAPPPSNGVLIDIPDTGRQLLALRSYVRAGSTLAERWSWTEEEIEAFQGSAEQQALFAEVEAVKAHFAQANPGYEIYTNTRVRSLNVQIRNWNRNKSVGAAAEEILVEWQQEYGSDEQDYGELDPDELLTWLQQSTVTHRARIAAPGLTRHGQARAIDFQIMRSGEIIAGADSQQIETVWRADKWDIRLKGSMLAAGPSFKGPLVSPYEPWHYEYRPVTGTL